MDAILNVKSRSNIICNRIIGSGGDMNHINTYQITT